MTPLPCSSYSARTSVLIQSARAEGKAVSVLGQRLLPHAAFTKLGAALTGHGRRSHPSASSTSNGLQRVHTPLPQRHTHIHTASHVILPGFERSISRWDEVQYPQHGSSPSLRSWQSSRPSCAGAQGQPPWPHSAALQRSAALTGATGECGSSQHSSTGHGEPHRRDHPSLPASAPQTKFAHATVRTIRAQCHTAWGKWLSACFAAGREPPSAEFLRATAEQTHSSAPPPCQIDLAGSLRETVGPHRAASGQHTHCGVAPLSLLQSSRGVYAAARATTTRATSHLLKAVPFSLSRRARCTPSDDKRTLTLPAAKKTPPPHRLARQAALLHPRGTAGPRATSTRSLPGKEPSSHTTAQSSRSTARIAPGQRTTHLKAPTQR